MAADWQVERVHCPRILQSLRRQRGSCYLLGLQTYSAGNDHLPIPAWGIHRGSQSVHQRQHSGIRSLALGRTMLLICVLSYLDTWHYEF